MASLKDRVKKRYESRLNIVGDLCILAALILGSCTVVPVNAPVPKSIDTRDWSVSGKLEYSYSDASWFQFPGVVAGLVLATVGNLFCAVSRCSDAASQKPVGWLRNALFVAYLLYFIPLIFAFLFFFLDSGMFGNSTVIQTTAERQQFVGIVVVAITGLHFVLGLVVSLCSDSSDSSDSSEQPYSLL